MPWMKHPERKDMYFHPIDYKDAQKDRWVVINPPRGQEMSEYKAISPEEAAADAASSAMPEGATIAGGVERATGGASGTDDAPIAAPTAAPAPAPAPAPEPVAAPERKKAAPEPESDPKPAAVPERKRAAPEAVKASSLSGDTEKVVLPGKTDFSGSKKK